MSKYLLIDNIQTAMHDAHGRRADSRQNLRKAHKSSRKIELYPGCSSTFAMYLHHEISPNNKHVPLVTKEADQMSFRTSFESGEYTSFGKVRIEPVVSASDCTASSSGASMSTYTDTEMECIYVKSLNVADKAETNKYRRPEDPIASALLVDESSMGERTISQTTSDISELTLSPTLRPSTAPLRSRPELLDETYSSEHVIEWPQVRPDHYPDVYHQHLYHQHFYWHNYHGYPFYPPGYGNFFHSHQRPPEIRKEERHGGGSMYGNLNRSRCESEIYFPQNCVKRGLLDETSPGEEDDIRFVRSRSRSDCSLSKDGTEKNLSIPRISQNERGDNLKSNQSFTLKMRRHQP